MAQRQAGQYHDFIWWLMKWGGLLIIAWWIFWNVRPVTARRIWFHITNAGWILFNFVFRYEIFGQTLFGWGLLVGAIVVVVFVTLATFFKLRDIFRWLT